MKPKEPILAKEGIPFVAVSLLLTLTAFFFLPTWCSALLLVVTLYNAYFFRNPVREMPSNPKAVVAPADGKVVFVGEVEEKEFLHRPMKKVSIFMNLFDVHVNRIPFDCEIKEIRYFPGSFVNASLSHAAEVNERNCVLTEIQEGQPMVVVQVAGLCARRIICDLKAGDQGARGSRLGIIRFGSRVDVYLPTSFVITAKIGDKVRNNASEIARLDA